MRPIRSSCLGRVQNVRPGVERARIDPEVSQFADVRVCGDLEDQGAEGLAVVCRAQDFLVRDRMFADDRRTSSGDGRKIHDRVEDGLDALVLESGARQDRHDAIFEGSESQPALDVLGT